MIVQRGADLAGSYRSDRLSAGNNFHLLSRASNFQSDIRQGAVIALAHLNIVLLPALKARGVNGYGIRARRHGGKVEEARPV